MSQNLLEPKTHGVELVVASVVKVEASSILAYLLLMFVRLAEPVEVVKGIRPLFCLYCRSRNNQYVQPQLLNTYDKDKHPVLHMFIRM